MKNQCINEKPMYQLNSQSDCRFANNTISHSVIMLRDGQSRLYPEKGIRVTSRNHCSQGQIKTLSHVSKPKKTKWRTKAMRKVRKLFCRCRDLLHKLRLHPCLKLQKCELNLVEDFKDQFAESTHLKPAAEDECCCVQIIDLWAVQWWSI